MPNKNPNITELEKKCQELRDFIIEHVAQNGGHLGATLGVIELTVALHKAFVFLGTEQSDKLVWDVGHQAYAHKILTNRKDNFHTIRKQNGLSGFPSIKESKFDDFGTGHSSTSISAILGMAVASQFSHNQIIKNRWHIAVIGDGAFTAGLPFEALNNIQNNTENGIKPNILIILNDNEMSIDKNVGTLKNHFKELSKQKWTKELNENFIIPSIFELFEGNFHGSIDGHNLEILLDFFEELKQNTEKNLYTNKVHFLHIKTVKGKGIIKNIEKENNQEIESKHNSWHAPANFDTKTGELLKSENSIHKKSFFKFQDIFGKTIIQLAKQNPKIIAITPAMASGSSLLEMQKFFPNRVFDVGIAEQHAVTFSAGLATQNMLPFCVIYSSFLQRSYDQIIHDVCIQELKVIFCIDRAGLVGADGATHQGVYDIAFLRAIPNLILAAPMDEIEFQNLLFSAQLDKNKTSFAIRYPRGEGFLIENNSKNKEELDNQDKFEEIKIGKARVLKEINKETKIVLLSYGIVGNFAKEAIEFLEKDKIAHYDMRFCKPLDETILHQIMGFQNVKHIITIEDGSKIGGFGNAIVEFLSEYNYLKNLDSIKNLGIPDQIIPHGSQQEQYIFCKINTKSIINTIIKII
ncbi:deoxyxylulose-5-phosphate synthase [Bernardetia litoralis DSM 6794]|uniref:1-deoxy-D-xylulose-5-phosphate synthase n=1 Tax=Bernardetia litoralis (strain ATCC 23117 / DSM 6794 / NBRC 15988 / NCIMB 1366 / Fx l1 / Sio-4) TaxID=880071 RepID=I4AI18_BERLS|nr:1-deoxy-D-xylulose-5-phosphate synthase [Bernardetia litoralis]AFM03603.1 deoxyxylulose-5-phosphate synthase [Bernardetia litoralis DSM 6794]